MNYNETKKLMALEASLWLRNGLETRTPAELQQIAAVWQQSLADIPYEAAAQALYTLVKEEKTPPSIAQIRGEVPKAKRIRVKKPDPPTVNHFGRGFTAPQPKPMTREEALAELHKKEAMRRPVAEALRRFDADIAELRQMLGLVE